MLRFTLPAFCCHCASIKGDDDDDDDEAEPEEAATACRIRAFFRFAISDSEYMVSSQTPTTEQILHNINMIVALCALTSDIKQYVR